ncbi:MAG TPA: hypothetical protein VJH34_01180 [archaeon]|nr:hypothetical protein [archaeon]
MNGQLVYYYKRDEASWEMNARKSNRLIENLMGNISNVIHSKPIFEYIVETSDSEGKIEIKRIGKAYISDSKNFFEAEIHYVPRKERSPYIWGKFIFNIDMKKRYNEINRYLYLSKIIKMTLPVEFNGPRFSDKDLEMYK